MIEENLKEEQELIKKFKQMDPSRFSLGKLVKMIVDCETQLKIDPITKELRRITAMRGHEIGGYSPAWDPIIDRLRPGYKGHSEELYSVVMEALSRFYGELDKRETSYSNHKRTRK